MDAYITTILIFKETENIKPCFCCWRLEEKYVEKETSYDMNNKIRGIKSGGLQFELCTLL